MTPDLFWIPGPWRGRLAIAARPRGGDWLDDEATGLRRAGLHAIVSLLEEDEAEQLDLSEERRAAERNGLRFISFPIRDRGVPASTQDAISLIGILAGLLEDGNSVAIHCRQGVGRSGMIAAGVLMTAGATSNAAIRTVSSSRGVPVPETREQQSWAEQLPAGLPVLRH